MKKIIFSIMFLAIFLVVAEESKAQNCRPNANQIAVFEHSNYRGKCRIKNVGSFPSSGSIGLENDTISSIIIGQNVIAVLCEHNNYKGRCQTFRTTDPNLSNNSVGNDSVSSIRVIQKSTTTPAASGCNPGANQISVFSGTNYSGRCVTKNAGNYSSAGAIGLANDSISSIKVGSNVRALVCRDVNYQGACYSINNNEFNLNNRQIRQNQISSIKVIRKNSTPVNRARHYAPNSNYKPCAVEGGRCNLRGRNTVAYGVNGKFRYKRNVTTIACNNSTFGDPVPGVPKRCYYAPSSNNNSARVVNGRNATIVNYSTGTFTQGSTGKWFEYKKNKRGAHATFTEINRDQWSIYLRKSDGARIQLDLRNKMIKINGRNTYRILSAF